MEVKDNALNDEARVGESGKCSKWYAEDENCATVEAKRTNLNKETKAEASTVPCLPADMQNNAGDGNVPRSKDVDILNPGPNVEKGLDGDCLIKLNSWDDCQHLLVGRHLEKAQKSTMNSSTVSYKRKPKM